MVQDNEQVRNDIKDSTSQMMDDRGILIKQCSELKDAKRQVDRTFR